MKNKFIKKIFNIALVCVFAIQLVGCGNNNNKIDMTKLEKTMMAADTDMPTMLAVNSDSDNTKIYLRIFRIWITVRLTNIFRLCTGRNG